MELCALACNGFAQSWVAPQRGGVRVSTGETPEGVNAPSVHKQWSRGTERCDCSADASLNLSGYRNAQRWRTVPLTLAMAGG